MIRKMYNLRVFTLILLTLFFSSCYIGFTPESNVTKTSNKEYESKSPDEVKLFFDKEPSIEYKEIGIVSAKKHQTGIGSGMSKPREEIFNTIRKEASSIGGDGVINIEEDLEGFKGTVIVFTSK